MRRIIWAKSARTDLDRINDWLTNERPPAFALQTMTAIRLRCNFLSDFRHGGGPLIDDLRKLKVPDTPYIIVYRLVSEGIEVVRLFHERQDWQSAL